MGVYIDMEMPKYGCDHCFLRTGNYCGRIEKNEHVVEYARKSERHPDCPLVPVPPHWRLIDADALIDKVIAKYLKFEREGKLVFAAAEIKQDICDLISDAPTIIPAEEGE